MPNPYILMPQQAQDMSGLSPVYQNMAAQQNFQNQMAQQGNQLTQQAGQTTGGSGMNPLALAAALRKDKKPNYDQWQTSGDMTYFGNNSNGQGAGLSSDMLSTLGL